jgi:hypothetical protein
MESQARSEYTVGKAAGAEPGMRLGIEPCGPK